MIYKYLGETTKNNNITREKKMQAKNLVNISHLNLQLGVLKEGVKPLMGKQAMHNNIGFLLNQL